jgi:hypothetical protein
MKRELSPLDFLSLGMFLAVLLWAVLDCGVASGDEGFVVTSRPAGFVVTERPTKHPLTFAPVTVKVVPECGCHLEGGCKCVDCKCAAALKNTGAVSVGGTNPTRAAAKPVAAPTYTAASGQWVRSCNGNTCQRVWQPSQPAAATKRAQVPQVQVQRRGLFGRRR